MQIRSAKPELNRWHIRLDSEARLAKNSSIQLDISIRATLDLALAKEDTRPPSRGGYLMESIITAAKKERITRAKVSQKNTEPNNLKDKSKGQHDGGFALKDDRLCLPPSRRIPTHRSKRETRTIA